MVFCSCLSACLRAEHKAFVQKTFHVLADGHAARLHAAWSFLTSNRTICMLLSSMQAPLFALAKGVYFVAFLFIVEASLECW